VDKARRRSGLPSSYSPSSVDATSDGVAHGRRAPELTPWAHGTIDDRTADGVTSKPHPCLGNWIGLEGTPVPLQRFDQFVPVPNDAGVVVHVFPYRTE
jgi:hypothetical protein